MKPLLSVADAPPVFVTCTAFRPAVPAGVVARSWVALTTVTLVAGVPPTVTAAPDAKPDPVTVMTVPPAVVPEAGETPLIESCVLPT